MVPRHSPRVIVGKAGALACAAKDDLVAVGEELAELAVGELEGDGASAG